MSEAKRGRPRKTDGDEMQQMLRAYFRSLYYQHRQRIRSYQTEHYKRRG